MLLSRGFYPDPRVYKEARVLAQQGHHITIIAWDRQCRFPPHEEIEGIKIERIRVAAGLGEGPTVLQVFKWAVFYILVLLMLLRSKCEVIHCHDLDTLIVGFVAGRLKRVKVVFDAHEPDYYAYWPGYLKPIVYLLRKLEKHLAKRADRVIVTNEYQFKKYTGWGVEDPRILWNFPEKRMIKDHDPEDFQNDLITLGRVGAVYQDTGIEEILEAFREMIKVHPNFRLRLVGRVIEGYQREFEALMDGFSQSIEIEGEYHYEDLSKVYQGIHVALLTYRKSAWFRNITPTKFFEALSQGIPVIATDIGGIGDIIREIGCGIVLDTLNVRELKEAMIRVAEDHDLRRKMGQRGLQAVRQHLNWDEMALRLSQIYAEL
jgi:glycosyltransferase involved in cell wall biosynthesis